MGQESSLQVQRGDPLAARLDDVLRPVADRDVASCVDAADIAGPEPAVVELSRCRVEIVALGHPGPAYLDLADAAPVPWQYRAAVVRNADLDAANYASRGGPIRDLALRGAVLGRERQGRDRACLGQAPALHDPHAEPLLVGLDQAARDRGPATHDHPQRREVDGRRVNAEQVVPHSRNGRGEGHPLRGDQPGERGSLNEPAGQHQVGPDQPARIRQAPGVAVEHGHDGQDPVVLAEPESLS